MATKKYIVRIEDTYNNTDSALLKDVLRENLEDLEAGVEVEVQDYQPKGLSNQDKTYMIGALATVLVRENLEPHEFSAKLYTAVDEAGLL